MTRKVLFTASTFSHIRNFHLPYLEYFQNHGWAVHVACGGETAPIPHADRVIRLPFKKRMLSPKNLRAAAMLRKEIRREGYDLISTHTSLAAFFTRLAVKGMKGRPPVVNTVHGYLFDDQAPALKRKILLAAERFTAPQTDLLLTMNRWDHELARRYSLGKRTANIPGVGVDFSRFDQESLGAGPALRSEWGILQDAFVLIYPAEFSKRKSQEVLIQALAELPERAVLVLPGQGALLEQCKALAVRLGLEERVVFPGQIGNMALWYAMADAAVSASRIEGLPFNVMEAMYCGLPVAASAVKGHTDLIAHGETGLLYPYGDVAACAAALRTLMDSEPLRRDLRQAARESVRQYELDRVLPQVTAHLEALVQTPEAGGV